MRVTLKLMLFVWAIAIFSTSCKEQFDAPQVINAGFSEIVYNAVTIGGAITNDGGAEISSQGVCWSTHPNPSIADGIVEDAEGLASFSVKVQGLENNIKYYFRTFATNIKGTEYGEEISTTLWLNSPSGTTVDFDGNKYAAIGIGNQVWLQENLATKHYQNGDPLDYLKKDSEWLSNKSGGYCYLDDDIENGKLHGYIYNGFAVLDERNVCPKGWKVPSKDDFFELTKYLGDIYTAGDLLKSITGWEDQDIATNNLSGFTALPGGGRAHLKDGLLWTQYIDQRTRAMLWTNTTEGADWVWYTSLFEYFGEVRIMNNVTRTCGMSIRCIKDMD